MNLITESKKSMRKRLRVECENLINLMIDVENEEAYIIQRLWQMCQTTCSATFAMRYCISSGGFPTFSSAIKEQVCSSGWTSVSNQFSTPTYCDHRTTPNHDQYETFNRIAYSVDNFVPKEGCTQSFFCLFYLNVAVTVLKESLTDEWFWSGTYHDESSAMSIISSFTKHPAFDALIRVHRFLIKCFEDYSGGLIIQLLAIGTSCRYWMRREPFLYLEVFHELSFLISRSRRYLMISYHLQCCLWLSKTILILLT